MTVSLKRCTILVILALILAACRQSEPPAKGEAGPPGPSGPAGPPGAASGAQGRPTVLVLACIGR
jgi:hypothetical protein